MTKVSVVVATYQPGEGLDRVIDSLDRQTLPQDEFESIFVDDGSPDGTLARLRELAATRPNMRVESIPNSGWPSRPRNVGIELARGEYVTFMDHDDRLFPDALAKAYAYAVEQRADVVNPKETETRGFFWGWDHYLQDLPADGQKDPTRLMPMRPHKLYRRELLLRHGIRFPEGARVIYEDIFFNLAVYARADRIAVLASCPFYQWVHTGANNSSSYGRDADEAWAAFEQIFAFIESGELDDEAAERLRQHTYGLRVLAMMLGPGALARDETAYARSLEVVPDFMKRHAPERLDAQLSPVNRARAQLVRSQQLDLLRPLALADRVTTVAGSTSVSWTGDGDLEIGCEVTWTDGDRNPLLFRREGDRILRRLPSRLESALPESALDVTEAVASARGSLSVRGRKHNVGWPVPTTSSVVVTDCGDGLVSIGTRLTGTLDVRSAAFGEPLDDDVWEVGVRSDFMGYASHVALKHDGPRHAALLESGPAVAEPSKSGSLLVRLDGGVDALLAGSAPRERQVTAERVGLLRARVTIPFQDLTVVGSSRLPCQVLLSANGRHRVHPGEVVAEPGSVRLVTTVSAPRGRYRIRVRSTEGSKPWATRLFATVGRSRRVTVRPEQKPRPKGRLWVPRPGPGGQAGGSSESR